MSIVLFIPTVSSFLPKRLARATALRSVNIVRDALPLFPLFLHAGASKERLCFQKQYTADMIEKNN